MALTTWDWYPSGQTATAAESAQSNSVTVTVTQ
jgi:hypothetical protein